MGGGIPKSTQNVFKNFEYFEYYFAARAIFAQEFQAVKKY
jgi:hypothetical protein